MSLRKAVLVEARSAAHVSRLVEESHQQELELQTLRVAEYSNRPRTRRPFIKRAGTAVVGLVAGRDLHRLG